MEAVRPPRAAFDPAAVLAQLAAAVGAAHLVQGAALDAFAADIFDRRARPLAMVAPASVDALQQVVRIAAAAGLPLLARGGGASYTQGYLPDEDGALLVDMRRLDAIVEINEDDAYVTVEAGVTWAALDWALAARGWRTPFRGPFSGAVATVGGTMAQHGISHGTGAHGVSAASVTALDVVLADGSLLRTGAPLVGGPPFERHHGPDLTGLFLGDCGAFGIKARISLRLVRAQADHAALSFGFERWEALHAGMRAAARERVDDTHFGLDASMVRGQLQRPRGIVDTLKIARRIWRATPGLRAPAAQLARMALAGERGLAGSPYLAHYIVEGGSPREVRARAARLRKALAAHGREIGNTIASVVRSQPFERMFHVLGPAGERWVPVHGLLAHSRVAGFHAGLQRLLASHADAMRRRGVWIGTLVECVGSGGFMVELGLYWPDAPDAYHRAVVDAKTLARLPQHAPDPALHAWIAALREELIALYRAHGAVHFQLGRVYPYAAAMDATGLRVVQALKAAVDPQRRMNAGVLGL
ncbi:MAG: FAD-binding oxidoreductase [Variovorax sp.]|nr:FAD-binding oxidoreductase [Variovorax sp.]